MERCTDFKDSRVEWIGLIPSEWDAIRARFLCDITTGNKDTVDRDDLGEYPFYVRSPIVEHIDTYSFDGEAVLTAGDGVGAGKVFHYAVGKFDYHQRVYNLHNFRRVEGRYLYYFMQENFYKEIERGNAKSTVDSIRLNMLQDFVISFPHTKAHQEQVIAYLDRRTAEIDTLFTELQSQAEMLDRYKRELVAEAVTKGLDKSVTMKDSGTEWIGEVPAHWDITPLRAFLKVISVKNNADLPLLSVEREKGVVDRETEGSENNHNRIPDDLSNYKVVRMGQFVMNKMKAWRGSYGVSNYDGIVSPAYYVFDLKFPNPSFFNYAIRSTKYIGFFGRDSYGIRTDQWDFKIGAIKGIPFAVPPVGEQRAIVEYLDHKIPLIEGLIADITAQLEKLKQYRQIVIHDAVTGKVKVTEG